MILVADSGSSKTDWILELTPHQTTAFRTRGINPFYLHEKEIVNILNKVNDIHKYTASVEEVYFFGAGCSSPDKREMVSNALSQVFKNAFINVENDVQGSVYATCGDQPGITCILGTGSNMAFFDGKEVHMGRFGLGYILGDEASGTYFGKKLITDFLYGNMPNKLSRDFSEMYKLDKETVIQHVYGKQPANLFLASLSMFMSRHPDHPYIKNILEEGFDEYVKTHVLTVPDYQSLNSHFVGSVAYYFQDVLKKVCARNGVKTGRILAHPIQGLYEFIRSREK